MDAEVVTYTAGPLLIAITSLIIWKLAYVGRRPLSRGAKGIVIAIVVWSSLPLLVAIGIWCLAEAGGHFGD